MMKSNLYSNSTIVLAFCLGWLSLCGQNQGSFRIHYSYSSGVFNIDNDSILEKNIKLSFLPDSSLLIVNQEGFYFIEFGKQITEFFYLNSENSLYRVRRDQNLIFKSKMNLQIDKHLSIDNNYVEDTFIVNGRKCYAMQLENDHGISIKLFLAYQKKSNIIINHLLMRHIQYSDQLIRFAYDNLILKLVFSNSIGKISMESNEYEVNDKEIITPDLPKYRLTKKLEKRNKKDAEESAYEIIAD